MQPLDPRIIDVQRIAGLISTAIFSVVVMCALAMAGWVVRPSWRVLVLGALGWLTMTLVMAAWRWRWPSIAYRHASWRLDDDGLEIRRGVIWRRVMNVPRTRVQHTDVSEGPIERSHGLSTLIVHTAGTEYARVALPGLARDTALRLRDLLLPKDGRDAV